MRRRHERSLHLHQSRIHQTIRHSHASQHRQSTPRSGSSPEKFRRRRSQASNAHGLRRSSHIEVDGDPVPIDEIAVSTSKKWFKKNLRFVDPERHVRYQVELARGSEALRDIFSRKGKFYGANDTSAAVGYAPLTDTERIVLHTERYINSPSFKIEFPKTGEDVKIMGSREGRDLNLTIAMAFVDRLIENENQYFERKAEVVEDVTRFVKSRVKFDGVNVDINTLDKRGRGMGGIYLTVLGTSADDGDGGQVGRGNRVNGVIPLNRPTCSEAAAGKNPVSHVGKIYNILNYEIAQHVH